MKSAFFWIVNAAVVGVTVGLMLAVLFGALPLETLQNLVSKESDFWMVGFALVVLMFISTVIAPVTTVFVIALAAGIIGPLPAALFSALGWFLGSLVAFGIARHFGKPLLSRFMNVEKLSLYEKYIPSDMSALTLVFLRMVVPPDLLSYAMGLFSRVGWKVFMLTGVGLLPFSFIGAYIGSALLEGNYTVFAIYLAAGIVLFTGVWYWIAKRRSDKPSKV